jgi:hypothetical protein
MGLQTTFHAPTGSGDFLGMRKTRAGSTEIVYDNGETQRMIWRVTAQPRDDARISDALQAAVGALRVLPTLFEELKKRSILIERVGI